MDALAADGSSSGTFGWWKRKSRWQQAAFFFSLAAFSVFVFNLYFTVYVLVRRGDTIQDGIGVLVDEACDRTRPLNTYLHFLINVLSATLLAGSNYCMQCAAAPTRSQVDASHANRGWLDIGIPSARNAWKVGPKNTLLWLILAVSSVPLHFFYNAAIFMSTPVNHYFIAVLPESVFNGRDITTLVDDYYWDIQRASRLFDAVSDGTMEEMSHNEVLDQYSRPFQSSRGTLLFVINDSEVPGTPPWASPYTPVGLYASTSAYPWGDPTLGSGNVHSDLMDYTWTCPGEEGQREARCQADVQAYIQNGSAYPFHRFGFRSTDVVSMYSQPTQENCRLHFNITYCWIVIVINITKTIAMLFLAFGKFDDPLLTVGDAVASFLKTPDPHTESMSLRSYEDFTTTKGSWDNSPQVWGAFRRRRYMAASLGRWLICIFGFQCCIVAFILTVVEGSVGGSAADTARQRDRFWEYELGTPNIDTFLTLTLGSGSAALQKSVLVANCWQAMWSIVYVVYNTLFTTLAIATEWNSYSIQKKGLRVSSLRQGDQRASYFLQLPYRYSLPLIVVSGLLHWLLSQSLFVVALDEYNIGLKDLFDIESKGYLSYVTLGYSPLGIGLVIMLGLLMMAAVFVTGMRFLTLTGMPIAGSCSAAIAAACHPGTAEPNVWEKSLQWGVVGHKGEVGHCAFTSSDVGVVERGKSYG
ncbi:hypothetical protein B0I35DRAFT_510389 [Stachybotrys elegans]|uniref:DUF6536 domain-containing protein n=1 Tax=Stachybotrys elegans TaxID=80388 RepID=A0A8K0SSK3_9HYPO|nr:hypothetical protein B0I35DRAFT_510389 [Stachybotrys elegans]